MEHTILTLPEASTIAGVTPDTLRQAILAGRLGAEKRGRDWFVTPGDLASYMAKRKPAPPRKLTTEVARG